MVTVLAHCQHHHCRFKVSHPTLWSEGVLARRLRTSKEHVHELTSIGVVVRGVSFPSSTTLLVDLTYCYLHIRLNHILLNYANVADYCHLAFSLVAPTTNYTSADLILAKLQVVDVAMSVLYFSWQWHRSHHHHCLQRLGSRGRLSCAGL